jgi:ribonuclease P protein subunit POP4
MLTPKNLINHELIGLKAEVIESSNKFQTGISGLVVDESKNTLTIETDKGIKKIQKRGTVIIFQTPDGKKVKVSGNKIVARPEERIKLKVKKW